ncbi:MAG: TetR/AcrR family transcriptional regulator [Candidatus Sericytochromatia bacterium]
MKIQIKITLNEALFLRDPEDTKLGKKILESSIILIHKLGFEKFTFKKLAEEIDSNEQSIYRYFENKHQLLKYLVAWYWAWLEYQLEIKTAYINEPNEKLKIVLKILSDSVKRDPNFDHIDEAILAHIVTKTAPISYITDEVNDKEIENILSSFDSLVFKISVIIKECIPNYKTPKALATSIIRLTREQIFFSKYFTNLTELKTSDEDTSEVFNFVENLVFTIIEKENINLL